MSKFNDFQTLLNAAEAYYYLGYSVIPLLGDLDPARPKVAARSWLVYQQRLANLNEFQNWFSPEGGAAALGIVTGRISRLVVLDFDSPDLFADFRRRYPDLLETRTVQSAGRALPHLYFHLPPHLHLTSHKRAGVDLLSDGRYVVAPPTTINSSAYRITRGGMPRALTTHDIQRLQSFLTDTQSRPSASYIKEESPSPASFTVAHYPIVGAGLIPPVIFHVDSKSASEEKTLKPSIAPLSMQWRGAGGEDVPTSSRIPSRAALHGLYHYWRTKGGRNDALFRTALYARDHGLNETQTRRLLIPLHISSPLSMQWRGAGGEKRINESPALRQREAHATIRSAFSRPPRAQKINVGEGLRLSLNSEQALPNSVREALMQRKLTCVVRTLEGLYQTGFRPGRGFSADQAVQTLKGIVGRDSVYNALNALAPNGQPFFPQHSPSALPQASKEAASQKQTLITKKCFFVTEKKSGIKKRGPKQRLFKFPTIDNLCKLLGVKPSGSDPLTRDDLTSAHQTRMALHRELIKRRPAEYTYRWMANRLGVSRRTINTYNRLIPIHSQPTYHETVLSWANINTLLTDEVLSGVHIETLLGKKYPALRAIAANLLAKGTYIRLKQRKGNLYWYGSDDPPPNILPLPHTSVGTCHLSNSHNLPRVGAGLIPPAVPPTPSVGIRHVMSAADVSPTPLSSVGKGLRPFRTAPTTDNASRRGAPMCAPVSSSASTPSPSVSTSPTPLSTQWRGAGGEDTPASTSALPTPSLVYGGGLPPFPSLHSVGKQHAVSVPLSNAFSDSPRPEGEGLGVRVSSTLPSDQHETLAQTIYESVNQRNDGTTKHLSLKNARKLVRSHTEKEIQFALQRLGQRTNLANPTGFFVTVLRSTARAN